MSRLHYPHMAVMPWEAEDKEICPYLTQPSTRAERIISSELVDPRFLAAFISGELKTRAPTYIRIKPADSTIPSLDSAQGSDVGGGPTLPQKTQPLKAEMRQQLHVHRKMLKVSPPEPWTRKFCGDEKGHPLCKRRSKQRPLDRESIVVIGSLY
ncbi:hypothetical protein DFH11DRAFT_1542615 [Phellopilus nigrolimitatus]|nr:hypothetical protein DFH11DRAFT_1542615 [Phellopilus nigrolimitatus]